MTGVFRFTKQMSFCMRNFGQAGNAGGTGSEMVFIKEGFNN